MKRILSVLLCVLSLCIGIGAIETSLPTDKDTTHTVSVTTVVPEVYTVTIPADLHIPYGKTLTPLGDVVLDGAVLAPNHVVTVRVETAPFANTANPNAVIPYTVLIDGDAEDTMVLTEVGETRALSVSIAEADWHRAVAGAYKATVDFSITCGPLD